MTKLKDAARVTFDKKAMEGRIKEWLGNHQNQRLTLQEIATGIAAPVHAVYPTLRKMIAKGTVSRNEMVPSGGYSYTVNGEVEVVVPSATQTTDPAEALLTRRAKLVKHIAELEAQDAPFRRKEALQATGYKGLGSLNADLQKLLAQSVIARHYDNLMRPHFKIADHEEYDRLVNHSRAGKDSLAPVIMAYIEKHGHDGKVQIKQMDMATELNVSRAAISHNIIRLTRTGKIERIGLNHYRVVQPVAQAEPTVALEPEPKPEAETLPVPVPAVPAPDQRLDSMAYIRISPTDLKDLLRDFAWERGHKYENSSVALEVLHDLVEYAANQQEANHEEN